LGSPTTYTAYVSKTSDRRLPDLRDLRRLCRTRVPRTRYVPHAADGQSDALAVARVDQPTAHPVLAHRSAHAPRPLDHLPARAPPLPLAHLHPRRTTRGAQQQRRPAHRPAHALAAVAPAPRAGVRAVPPHPCAVSAPSDTRYARTRAGSVPPAASDRTAAGGTATAAKAARKTRATAAERAAGTATTTATTAGAARARAAATASLPVPSRRPVCPPPLV